VREPVVDWETGIEMVEEVMNIGIGKIRIGIG